VVSGDISPNAGAVVIHSINAGLRGVRVGLDLREQLELEECLEELQKFVESMKEKSSGPIREAEAP
jgi:hypothetical protein